MHHFGLIASSQSDCLTSMPVPDTPPLASRLTAPMVRTEGDHRTLAFAPGEVQSDMRLSDPTRLVLAYCRAIMCFALFVPRPRHILMVGLGGGSLAKFCYRHFPDAQITVLEVRADVIALRGAFAVPADDARFRVLHADAANWLAQFDGSADVIVVDGFDRGGLPAALGTARFYSHCRRALADGGVLAANIFSYDPAYPGMLARLSLMFDNHLCRFAGAAGNNHILFAVKAAPGASPPPRALRVQRWVAAGSGLGTGPLNRLLVQAVVAWLARR
jgi:spermidine synthase